MNADLRRVFDDVWQSIDRELDSISSKLGSEAQIRMWMGRPHNDVVLTPQIRSAIIDIAVTVAKASLLGHSEHMMAILSGSTLCSDDGQLLALTDSSGKPIDTDLAMAWTEYVETRSGG